MKVTIYSNKNFYTKTISIKNKVLHVTVYKQYKIKAAVSDVYGKIVMNVNKTFNKPI